MAEIKEVIIYGSNEWSKLKPLNLSKIVVIDFPKEHYIQEEYKKNQIVLHHTVSGPGVRGDVQTWLGTTKRIGTCIIVDRDGTPYQCFSSKYWAGHLGCGNIDLDKHSIGVELDSWGGLVLGDGTIKQFGKNEDGTPRMIKTKIGKYYAAYGNIVDVPMVYYEKGFRGYYYYESYTKEQLKTIGELLLLWRDRYSIPLTYHENMWDVSKNALKGEPGVWSHVSYRKPSDKQDCHPDPNLISMLRTVSNLK